MRQSWILFGSRKTLLFFGSGSVETRIAFASADMGLETEVPSFKLPSGALMPAVGFGCGGLETDIARILKAIEVGYRHFDTAAIYQTEGVLGRAIKEAIESGMVKREELFVGSKLWCKDITPTAILPAVKKSLSELQLEYLDMYLIHWPVRVREESPFGMSCWHLDKEDIMPWDVEGCWKALEHCVELGLLKHIGVSNFSVLNLKKVVSIATTLPAQDQVEMHPGFERTKIVKYCKKMGIVPVAWSPLGAPGYGEFWGSNVVLDSPIMKEIAGKHGKTIAQVALRWSLDHGCGLITKSKNPERMAQSLQVFGGWTLTEEDHEKIKGVPYASVMDGKMFVSEIGPYKTIEELWDDGDDEE